MSLFPEPAPVPLELSRHFAGYARTPGDRVTYTRCRFATDRPCEECQWRQHETRGTCPPRRQATYRRVLVALGRKPTIELCAEHRKLWAARDQT